MCRILQMLPYDTKRGHGPGVLSCDWWGGSVLSADVSSVSSRCSANPTVTLRLFDADGDLHTRFDIKVSILEPAMPLDGL